MAFLRGSRGSSGSTSSSRAGFGLLKVVSLCILLGFAAGVIFDKYLTAWDEYPNALIAKSSGAVESLVKNKDPAKKRSLERKTAAAVSLVSARHWADTCGYDDAELAAIEALPHGHLANEKRYYHPREKRWMAFEEMSKEFDKTAAGESQCIIVSTKGQVPCLEEECLHQIHLRAATTDVVIALVLIELSGIYGPGYEFVANFTEGINYVLDAGANIGLASVVFSTMYPDATIIAVEPSDDNFAMLKKNVANFPNVKPVHAGLWWKKTRLALTNGPRAEGLRNLGFMVDDVDNIPEDKRIAELDAVSIPSLLKDYRIRSFDFLKIDIEGSEKEVFTPRDPDYDISWLKKAKLLCLEIHDDMRKGAEAAVLNAIEKLGDRFVPQPMPPGGDFKIWASKDISPPATMMASA